MKRLSTIMMCLFAMMAASLSAKAQEVTITLYPGWTWISFPKAEVLDISTALGGFVPVEGDIVKSQFSSSAYVNGYWRGGVTHFMPGWGYMYYSNRSEIVSFVFASSTPQSQVQVTTSEPMLITAISAMGGGEVITTDGTYILVRGLCWATHENPTTNEDSFVEEGSGVGSFSATMTGLNWSTTYYYRAYAVTANSTVYGEQQSFTTRDGIPTLTTTDIANITAISATSGGNITDNGGLNVTARGVCWSTSPNPTVNDSHTTNGTGTGSFTSSITGLEISTTYYVCAYATTNAGTAYGNEQTFTTRDGIPTVTTAEITNIEGTYANGGGNITDDGGLAVTARGVCWSTSPNPTLADVHTFNGNGMGSFSGFITGLTMSTTYYVRAYATNSFVTVYGNQLSFTTNEEHVYVDLGLPSGLLWATCNIGANSPEEYGDYFAWGETQPKDYYDWSTYHHSNGGTSWQNPNLTKYCNNSNYGYNGLTDNLTTLLHQDDAATANWGADWRMPTKEEFQELYNNTTIIWTQQNGVNGRLFTASNGNSLFLPAAGNRYNTSLSGVGSYGDYWSSSLSTDYYPYEAWYIGFNSNYCNVDFNGDRWCGQSVRAVCSTYPTGAIDGKFSINANGDQVYFSQGNLQFQASTHTWRFAENQWDYVGTQNPSNGYAGGTVSGSDNSNISSYYNGWIDLFGWGTSGYFHGANCYQPWSTSCTNSDYYAYGFFNYNLNDSNGIADWGYNSISNGGNQENIWRTLTIDEWEYVLFTRTTISGIRYAKANVNDVNGVVLLPDDWDANYYNLSNTNSSNADFSSNVVTISQWNVLEQAGAVFLPIAGSRIGTWVYGTGFGEYWSSTCEDSGACFVEIYDSNFYTATLSDRYPGLSVRLVHNY